MRDVLDQVQGVSLSAAAISIRDTDWAGWGAPANTTLWNPATHTFEAAGVEAFATAFDAVSSGAIRYEVGLARNAYGALTAVADSAVAPGVRSRDAAFAYDLAGRLVAAEVSEHHFEYAYDALQNMTRRELVVVPGGAITPDLLSGDYRHGDAATGKRRLQQVTMPGTSTALATFSYDLAGRMTRVGLSAATDTTMAFDAFDRVRVVDEPGSGVSQHRYDAAGERATTVWADGRIERYFGGGLTQREGRLELHVGLGGARVVARVNVPELPDGTASISDGLGGAPAVVYLHQGVGHGPTVVTDASGAVIEERVFEPYGTPLWVDADYELERLGWNGKAVDPSTGWSDHGARWHATRFARWLSVDPPLKGPGGLVEHGLMATPYGFVAGNPVMFWDPDGNAGWPFESIDDSVDLQISRGLRPPRANLGTVIDIVTDFIPIVSEIKGVIECLSDGDVLCAAAELLPGPPPRKLKKAKEALEDAVAPASREAKEGLAKSGVDTPRPSRVSVRTGTKLPKEELLAPPPRRGLAPIAKKDGRPVELHHRDQEPDSPLDEMAMTDHRGKGNFRRNHANTGQEQSKIDRAEFEKQKRDYWTREWDSGRFDDL